MNRREFLKATGAASVAGPLRRWIQAELTFLDKNGMPQQTHELAPDFTGCAYPDPDYSYFIADHLGQFGGAWSKS